MIIKVIGNVLQITLLLNYCITGVDITAVQLKS